MSDWIKTGNWADYRKAGLLYQPEYGTFKTVLLFFETVENKALQHDLGYFNYYTQEWHLCFTTSVKVHPSHFQLLTAPGQ